MRLIITQHILFGALRPWATARIPEIALIKNGSSNLLNDGTDPTELLESYPHVVRELQLEFKSEEDQINQVESFVAVNNEEPFNRITWWYFQLLQFEKSLFLHSVITKIQNLEEAVDKTYKVSLTIRYLVDLLNNTDELVSDHSGEEVEYILRLVEKHLMQLVLDISLRFQYLEEVKSYDEDLLFVTILDRKPPKRSLFYKTVAYWKYRLDGLLKQMKSNDEIVKLRKEIFHQLEKKTEQPIINDQKFTRLLRHLDNALFLLIYEAPFIDNHPEKLLDENYCAEWVQGIRHDFLGEEDADQASSLFNDLLNVSEQFEQLLRIGAGIPEDKLNYISEAQHFLSAVKRIFEYPSKIREIAVNNRGKSTGKDKQRPDFVESFHRRFMTIEEFDSVLPGTREATMRYIKNGNIRLLKISREVKFLYRSDVERFLEERTIG